MRVIAQRSTCVLALATLVGALGCSDSGATSTMNTGGSGGQASTTAGTGGAVTGGSGNAAGSSRGGGGAGNASGSGGDAGSAPGGTSNSGGGGTGGSSGGSAGGSAGSGGTNAGAGFRTSPNELVFGAVQQTQSPAQSVKVTAGSAALKLASVKLDAAAAGTSSFELVSPPADGTSVAAGQSLDIQVRFKPSGIALFQSKLVIEAVGADMPVNVGLYGLGTKGLEGENEPYLKIVLDTLGYQVDVGGSALLSTTTPLVGSEVAAQQFQAAGAGAIEIVPVARYSPQEPIPYGYYTAQAETVVGTISNDQYQALNPKTDAGSMLTFADPGSAFGIFTTSKTHKTYSEDSKNAGNQVKHAVRSYPLKDRAGTAIANAYLVCFEEAANGDYQDYVFTLKNVKPAP